MSFTKKYQNSCFPIYCCFSTPTGIFTYIYIILWYYTLWPKVYIYTQLYKYNVYMSFTKKIPMHNPHSYNVRYTYKHLYPHATTTQRKGTLILFQRKCFYHSVCLCYMHKIYISFFSYLDGISCKRGFFSYDMMLWDII